MVAASLVLLLGACSNDNLLTPAEHTTGTTSAIVLDPEMAALELVSEAGWPLAGEERISKEAPASADRILSFDREVLYGDVAHYRFLVQVGPGPHDMFALHRVVREREPNEPIQTRASIFLQHGDAVGFVKFIFGSASASVPDDRSYAVYLAMSGVDVWGIDQPWILVPQSTSDFSFMADWGLQHQVDNLEVAIATARNARRLTGSGFHKMLLLGYSSGVWTGYALLNQETQQPPGLRNVTGYIALDGYYKTNDEDQRLSDCAGTQALQARLDSGDYADQTPTLFRVLGQLAQLIPSGPSPVFPGFTNRLAALFAGTATWNLATPSWFHYVGGYFDVNGLPTGLRYSDEQEFYDFLQTAAYYEPVRFMCDYSRVGCDEEEVPFDDHIGEIDVPIFEVGDAGGLSSLSNMTELVGSRDASVLYVALLGPDERRIDIGHIDLMISPQAPELFWRPMLEWIQSHSPGPRGRGQTTSD